HTRKTAYVWEGVIGHTAEKQYGAEMHTPFWPIKKMVLSGSNLFYTCEYNEGGYQIQMFSPTNAQAVLTNFSFKTENSYPSRGLTFTNLLVQTNTIFAAGNTFQRMFVLSNAVQDTLRTVTYDQDGPHPSDH